MNEASDDFISLMRPLKRLLLFACELGVLVLGLILSLTAFGAFDNASESTESPFASAVLVSVLILAVVVFVALRRRTRSWKIEYDAAGWMLAQAERRLHPTRARYKRTLKRTLVWAPTVIAAAVLLFFPAASHLIRPGPQSLVHYRLSIPWTLMITSVPDVPAKEFVTAFVVTDSSGRFGLTPFWKSYRFSSEMGFGSQRQETVASAVERFSGVAHLVRKEFRLTGVALSCWQYLPPEGRRFRVPRAGDGLWQVDCETPMGVQSQHFYAWFRRSYDDIPAFYEIVENVRPFE